MTQNMLGVLQARTNYFHSSPNLSLLQGGNHQGPSRSTATWLRALASFEL